jgi:hypothetical protein
MRSKVERQPRRREGGTGHLAGDPPVVLARGKGPDRDSASARRGQRR